MSPPPSEQKPNDEEPIDRDLARRLVGPAGRDPAAQDSAAQEADAAGSAELGDGGPLRLDKSGALLGLPKRPVVKALRKEDDEAPAPLPEPAPERPRKAQLPARRDTLRPNDFVATVLAPDDVEEIAISGGSFLFGDGPETRELPPFAVDKYPVTNAAYQAFVEATGHRPPLYWPMGQLPDDLRDHPVVGVDYFDALAYAQWKGKDLPFEDEWERAARGTDGRTFPWGNDSELDGAHTARSGIKMTLPVTYCPRNVSPDGVCDTVGNAWELTHSPAPGGGVVVRGGSWYDFALYAKTYFRFAARPDARNGTIGFRCVRRPQPRAEAREVPVDILEAEVAARRGSHPLPDFELFEVERRDLVPDYARLRALTAEAQAAALLAPLRAPEAASPLTPQSLPTAPPTAPRASPLTPAASVNPTAGAPATASARSAPVEPAAPPPPPTHVTSAPKARPVAPDRTEGQRVVEQVAAGADLPATEAPARAMPRWLWVLVLAGIALLVGLIAVLVGGEAPTPAPPPHVPPAVDPPPASALAGLPEPKVYGDLGSDGQPPVVFDGADASQRERLQQGVWLLVFLDPDQPSGAQTVRAVYMLHRQLVEGGVHVAAVIPRARHLGSGGAPMSGLELSAYDRANDRGGFLHDGLPVWLDDGELDAAYGAGGSHPTAVLLFNGLPERRMGTASGGFSVHALARLARRAWELAPDR